MSRADLNQGEIIKTLRSVGASVCCLTQVGNGCPDILTGFKGENYLMEIKNKNTKGKLRPSQVAFFEKWRGSIHLVESASEALKIIGVE